MVTDCDEDRGGLHPEDECKNGSGPATTGRGDGTIQPRSARKGHRKPAADAVIVLLAMSMGAQLAAIRFLKVPDLLTVVLTMTVIGLVTERGRGWNDPASCGADWP